MRVPKRSQANKQYAYTLTYTRCTRNKSKRPRKQGRKRDGARLPAAMNSLHVRKLVSPKCLLLTYSLFCTKFRSFFDGLLNSHLYTYTQHSIHNVLAKPCQYTLQFTCMQRKKDRQAHTKRDRMHVQIALMPAHSCNDLIIFAKNTLHTHKHSHKKNLTTRTGLMCV